MTKYYITSRHYRGPNVFKQFEGWTEWTDYSTVCFCYPTWVFDKKKDAEKLLRKLKAENNMCERLYDTYVSISVTIILPFII